MIVFSGIVGEVGRVITPCPPGGGPMTLGSDAVARGLAPGGSVAVNGCCLTVTEVEAGRLGVDVTPETLRCTTLGEFVPGQAVNLEAPLTLGERIGGHLVTGHVDAVGVVRQTRREGNSLRVWFEAPPAARELVAAKGCIAVDGISLTVVEPLPDGFTVSLVPLTLSATVASGWRAGTRVNLEGDLIARYVLRGLSALAVPYQGPPATRAAAS